MVYAEFARDIDLQFPSLLCYETTGWGHATVGNRISRTSRRIKKIDITEVEVKGEIRIGTTQACCHIECGCERIQPAYGAG